MTSVFNFTFVPWFRSVAPYIHKFRNQTFVVGIAGEAIAAGKLQHLAQDFSQVQSSLVRVGKWPIYLPFATQLMPAACFDMRQALQLHAASVARAMAAPPSPSRRDRAYVICAELFLFQHSCHWFCRSKTTASARLLARHRTRYAQVLASVAPQTRTQYLALTSL